MEENWFGIEGARVGQFLPNSKNGIFYYFTCCGKTPTLGLKLPNFENKMANKKSKTEDLVKCWTKSKLLKLKNK